MEKESLYQVFSHLEKEGVKYALVGGLAVNFHGYQRFTKDVDLIVSLSTENLETLITTLETLSFQPIYPISLSELKDEEKRKDWIENRNMTVFSLTSSRYPTITLDLFTDPPYDFSEIEADLSLECLKDDLYIPVIDLDRLIDMKTLVGREQDRIDVQHLQKIKAEHLSRES